MIFQLTTAHIKQMTERKLPGLNGQWIRRSDCEPLPSDGDERGFVQELRSYKEVDGREAYSTIDARWDSLRQHYWRPMLASDRRPVSIEETQSATQEEVKASTAENFKVGQHWKTVDGSVVEISILVGEYEMLATGVSGPILDRAPSTYMWRYRSTGECHGRNYEYNLVELVKESSVSARTVETDATKKKQFDLEPGDTCRFLDGPLMMYEKRDVCDDGVYYKFSYWNSRNQSLSFLTLDKLRLSLVRKVQYD